MNADVVVGIDSSTTSTKAIAWDRQGRMVAEGVAPIPMANFAPGVFEQAPADWWRSAVAALRAMLVDLDPARVAAVAIANQRETVGFLDNAGEAVRPAIVWLDERCRPDVAPLVTALSETHLREVTGKPPDPTPAVYSLAWLKRCEPNAFAQCAHFVDAHGYLVWRLTGERATSWASADPQGLFDIARRQLDPTILTWFGLSPERFFPAYAPGTILGHLNEAAATATGLPVAIPVVCGGGDGQAGALGCAVLGEGRACLNLGTATVAGVYGNQPLTSRHWRTMTSLAGSGYIFELVLRTGAFLTDWMVGVLGFDPRRDPDCYTRLEGEAADLPPGSHGLLLLPHWSGVMNPHWSENARGVIAGLGPEHGRGHLYRALIEGIALEMAAGFAALANHSVQVREIVAIGGGAKSPLWRRIMADAIGHDVIASRTVEASALGAGMLAARAVGWYPTLEAAAAAMQGDAVQRLTPDPRAHERYRALLAIQEGVYPAMQDSFRRLAAFRTEGLA